MFFFSPRSTIISLSFLVVLFDTYSFIGKYFGQFGLFKAEKQQFAIQKSTNSVTGNQFNVLIKSSLTKKENICNKNDLMGRFSSFKFIFIFHMKHGEKLF